MTKLKFVAMFVAMLVFAASAQAVVDLAGALENPSFELPGVGKTMGFDIENGAYNRDDGTPVDVPGWDGGVVDDTLLDSGVELPWVTPVPDGEWAAYMMGTDPALSQTSSAVIEDGETYTLNYWLANTGSWWTIFPPEDASTPIPMVMLYADNGTNKIPLVIDFPELAAGNAWAEYNISYTADYAFVGYNIGIEFDNLNGTGVGATPPWENNCWMGVDIVPEPATITLLGLGGLALSRIRRKR